MPQVIIDNPVINSPFRAPTRHFIFNDEGITNEIESGRRPSSYFIPIEQPRGYAWCQIRPFSCQWFRLQPSCIRRSKTIQLADDITNKDESGLGDV
jgi:hypothetical protein